MFIAKEEQKLMCLKIFYKYQPIERRERRQSMMRWRNQYL